MSYIINTISQVNIPDRVWHKQRTTCWLESNQATADGVAGRRPRRTRGQQQDQSEEKEKGQQQRSEFNMHRELLTPKGVS